MFGGNLKVIFVFCVISLLFHTTIINGEENDTSVTSENASSNYTDNGTININTSQMFNILDINPYYNLTIENNNYQLILAEKTLLSPKLNLSEKVKFYKGKVNDVNNSHVSIMISSNGYLSCSIDINEKQYKISTNRSLGENRYLLSNNTGNKTTYKTNLTLNSITSSPLKSNQTNNISLSQTNLTLNSTTSSPLKSNQTNNISLSQTNLTLNSTTFSLLNSKETKTLSPGAEITEDNEIYYLCRMGLYWNYLWEARYGSDAIYEVLDIINDVEDVFSRDLNIKFFITDYEHISESENWEHGSWNELYLDFEEWADSNNLIDYGINIDDITDMFKHDRVILFCVMPPEVNVEHGYTPGDLSHFCLFNDAQVFDANVILVAHELGHTFGGEHKWGYGGLGSGFKQTIMVNGFKTPIEDYHLIQFTTGNQLGIATFAIGLRWRVEVFDGTEQTSISPHNIQLLSFYSYYVLAPKDGITHYTKYEIFNLNTYSVTFNQLFFARRLAYRGEIPNLDFGHFNNVVVPGLHNHKMNAFKFYSKESYNIWPSYSLPGSWGPYRWQESTLPVFGDELLYSSPGPHTTTLAKIHNIKTFGSSPHPKYEPILYEFKVECIAKTHHHYTFADFLDYGGIFVHCTDPFSNNMDFGHTQMRIEVGEYSIFRTWIIPDSSGQWEFWVAYYYQGFQRVYPAHRITVT